MVTNHFVKSLPLSVRHVFSYFLLLPKGKPVNIRLMAVVSSSGSGS